MRQVVEKVFCDCMYSAEVLPELNSFLSYETPLWGSSNASNTQPDSGLQPHVAHHPAPIALVFGKTLTQSAGLRVDWSSRPTLTLWVDFWFSLGFR